MCDIERVPSSFAVLSSSPLLDGCYEEDVGQADEDYGHEDHENGVHDGGPARDEAEPFGVGVGGAVKPSGDSTQSHSHLFEGKKEIRFSLDRYSSIRESVVSRIFLKLVN